MQIDIRDNIKEVTRYLTSVQKDQIPFAASRTLNDLAYKLARQTLPDETEKTFEGGATAFTRKGFRYTKSTKRDLIATVFVDPARAKYMQFQIAGGTRYPNKRAILVATENSRVNRFGNIPRGTMQQLINNKDKYFKGIPKGKHGDNFAGIWERYGRKNQGRIRMVAAYTDKAQYRPKFMFAKIGEDVVFSRSGGFNEIFIRNLNYALATQKR